MLRQIYQAKTSEPPQEKMSENAQESLLAQVLPSHTKQTAKGKSPKYEPKITKSFKSTLYYYYLYCSHNTENSQIASLKDFFGEFVNTQDHPEIIPTTTASTAPLTTTTSTTSAHSPTNSNTLPAQLPTSLPTTTKYPGSKGIQDLFSPASRYRSFFAGNFLLLLDSCKNCRA